MTDAARRVAEAADRVDATRMRPVVIAATASLVVIAAAIVIGVVVYVTRH
jgi:hypothetical protein